MTWQVIGQVVIFIIETVIDTFSSMPFSYQPEQNDIQQVDVQGAKALVDAAKAVGVKHFMEVWLTPMVGFDIVNAKATIYGSGDQPISWISIDDVMQFAVESLTNPAARNTVLELGGHKSVSPHQVIQLFKKEGGKIFEVTHVPAEALKAQMESATEPMQKSFAGLMACYALGDPIEMQATLKAFPSKLTSIQDYVKKVMLKT